MRTPEDNGPHEPNRKINNQDFNEEILLEWKNVALFHTLKLEIKGFPWRIVTGAEACFYQYDPEDKAERRQ